MNEKNNNIVNVIFFIRATEPRMNKDLLGTMKNQLEIVKRHSLKSTFLLEYDAICDPKYVSAIKECDVPGLEIGGWLEIVQPLVEQAGLTWRGRYPWDWHSDVGFSVGYTPEERCKLIDVFMAGFKENFGFYPKSIGSWMIDAVTLQYMADRYGVEASCNCRDQWGTDGYTLWGGYYGHAFYPSKKNAFCPAQSRDEQINIPVFRMLGSDQIYQYDNGLTYDKEYHPSECQNVVTLEPVYCGGSGGGGVPAWVDWYLQENFMPSVSFNYTQAGQENSFGWDAMKDGLEYQFSQLERLQKEGKLRIEPLCESGRWFKNRFTLTPPTSISAMTDWKNKGHRTVWYDSRFYRVNVYQEGEQVWIRDIHKFDDRYEERYLTKRCDSHAMHYDNLPVIDGNCWSGGQIRAGMYPEICNAQGICTPIVGQMTAEYPDENTAIITVDGNKSKLKIRCEEDRIVFSLSSINNGRLSLLLKDGKGKLANVNIEKSKLCYYHNNYSYTLPVEYVQSIEHTPEGIRLTANDNTLTLIFGK